MIKRFMLAFVSVSLIVSVVAQARLSPAMEIIASRMEKKCCVTAKTVYSFGKEDFEGFAFDDDSKITVTSLPTGEKGVLTLSGVSVKTGQTLAKEQLDRLCFSPAYGFTGQADIVFQNDETQMKICMNVVPEANYAPKVGNMEIETQKNIAVFSSFSAADPDGDNFDVEIVRYPTHGSVRITGDGQLMYRPVSEYTGNDSFSYRATDVYGNVSEISAVKVKVSRPAADIYFDDMHSHWAHNSAVKMASTGLMRGEDIDGKLCFNPDTDMTRGDFLALSLIMSGHEKNIPMVTKTVFADDSMIPGNIKSYVQYAYDKGIISGYDNGDGSINFESLGAVSRAEAAVIMDKILNLSQSENAVPSYKDASDIPVWASGSVAALSTIGIINGDAEGEFSADRNLSRAEGAEMICNVANYIKDKEDEAKKQEKKQRNIFNLFGLLG